MSSSSARGAPRHRRAAQRRNRREEARASHLLCVDHAGGGTHTSPSRAEDRARASHGEPAAASKQMTNQAAAAGSPWRSRVATRAALRFAGYRQPRSPPRITDSRARSATGCDGRTTRGSPTENATPPRSTWRGRRGRHCSTYNPKVRRRESGRCNQIRTRKPAKRPDFSVTRGRSELGYHQRYSRTRTLRGAC
jgi:hypothetical protein